MEKQYIYKISSPIGKVYIGRSKDFNSRMNEHLAMANKGIGFAIHNAIRKYGWENMTKEIIAEVDNEENAILVEESLILQYNSVIDGYNQTYGGSGKNVWKNNPELLQKLKNTLSNLYSGENNPMYGKTHSDEAKQKQKEKAKGRYSLEWFVDRYGDDGETKYEERRMWLKNRNLKKDENGRFIKNK